MAALRAGLGRRYMASGLLSKSNCRQLRDLHLAERAGDPTATEEGNVMRTGTIVLLGFVVVTSCCSVLAQETSPDQQAVERLAAALWKEPPKSFDVTFYMEIWKSAPASGSAGQSPAPAAPEVTAGKEETHRVVKRTVVVLADNMRIDEADVQKPGDPVASFSRTFVNVSGTPDRDPYGYNIEHAAKCVFVSKSRWKRADVSEWGRLPEGPRAFMQVMLGEFKTDPDGKPAKDSRGHVIILPDKAKIANALSNNAPGKWRLAVNPAQEFAGRKVDVFEAYINAPEATYPVGRYTLDADDCDICYRAEVIHAKTGKPVMLYESSDFRLAAPAQYPFPYAMSVTTYTEGGSVKERKQYTVENASVGADADESIFDLKVPEGYAVAGEVPAKKDVSGSEGARSPADGKDAGTGRRPAAAQP